MELINVIKKYDDNLIFDNLSFKFNEVGFYGIIGPSGCGKSTLLNIISGKDNNYEGNIIGENKNLSFVYQDFHLIDYYTVFENLMISMDTVNLCSEEKEKMIHDMLKQYHLQNYANKKVRYLSGGEKQRIVIIRALLNNAEILLCDEPTSFLDKKNSINVFEMLKEVSRQCLVIVVSHNVKLMSMYADVVLKIENNTLMTHLSNNIIHKQRNNHSFNHVKVSLKRILYNIVISYKRIYYVFLLKEFCLIFLMTAFSLSFILINQSHSIARTNINDFNGYDTLVLKDNSDKMETFTINDILDICQLDDSIVGYRFDVDEDWPFGIGVNDPNIKVESSGSHSWWKYPLESYLYYCNDGSDNINDSFTARTNVYEMIDFSYLNIIHGDANFINDNDVILSLPVAQYLVDRYHLDNLDQLIHYDVELYSVVGVKEGCADQPIHLRVIGICDYDNYKYQKIFMRSGSFSKMCCEIFDFNTYDMGWYNVEIMLDSSRDLLAVRDNLNDQIKEINNHFSFVFNDEVVTVSSIKLFSNINMFLMISIIIFMFIMGTGILYFIIKFENSKRSMEWKLKLEYGWNNKVILIQRSIENLLLVIVSGAISYFIHLIILDKVNQYLINISNKMNLEDSINLFDINIYFIVLTAFSLFFVLMYLGKCIKGSEQV